MRSRFFLLTLLGVACFGCPLLGWAHGDLHDAITEASRRIAESPTDVALYFQRGEFHRLHDEAAESDYRRTLELNPEFSGAVVSMAQLRLAANRIWLTRKARLLEKTGRRTKAIAAWEPAAKLLAEVLLEKQSLPADRRIAEEIQAAVARLDGGRQ